MRAVVDALLAGAACYLLYLFVAAGVDTANGRSELRLLLTEAETLYDALEKYGERNHGYPDAYSEARFDPETLDPLRKRGYYRGHLVSHTYKHRVDAYDSPDDRGPNREFWVEMTLRTDPTIRVLVARSDDAPIAGGTWRDGVFVYRDGELDDQLR